MERGESKEPEYDLERINNDDAYAFEKIRELANYLPTIEPFAERAKWFYRTSRILTIDTSALGTSRIVDKSVYSRTTNEGIPVDKNGNPIEGIIWKLEYSTETEKGIARKQYFQEYYRTSKNDYLSKPRLDFEQLRKDYINQAQTDYSKRLQLEWVAAEIHELQQHINIRVNANPDSYGTRKTKEQLQDAAVRIERELGGLPGIKWSLFSSNTHFAPFALLWGLVEYKRFLETEESTAPVTSTPPPPERAMSDAKKENTVRLILARLNGMSPQKRRIMSEADFNRLITYTDHLVLTDTLPTEIVPIAQTDISNEHIRYTFYLLHSKLFGSRRIKQSFIDFLHRVFTQFTGTQPRTTKAKFATAPKSYHRDFTGYIGEAS